MFDNHYECDIYQPEDIPAVDSITQEAIFLIDLFSETPFLRNKNLIVLQQHVLSGSVNWPTLLSTNLLALNVPHFVHPSIIQKITDYARAAAHEGHNRDCEIVPLVVTIKAVVSFSSFNEEEAAAMAEAVRRSISFGQDVNLMPASEASIKALKEIEVEGCCSKQCVICLEEMKVGSKATALPCFHIFHQDCIINWLNNSSLCPLCRFKMS